MFELDTNTVKDFVRVDAQIRAIGLEIEVMQSRARLLVEERLEASKEQSELYARSGLDEAVVLVVANKRTMIQETGETLPIGRVIVRETGKLYVPPVKQEQEEGAVPASVTTS